MSSPSSSEDDPYTPAERGQIVYLRRIYNNLLKTKKQKPVKWHDCLTDEVLKNAVIDNEFTQSLTNKKTLLKYFRKLVSFTYCTHILQKNPIARILIPLFYLNQRYPLNYH